MIQAQRMQMGDCKHEQVKWVKVYGDHRADTEIWCCPKAHGAPHRRILEVKGFRPIQS